MKTHATPPKDVKTTFAPVLKQLKEYKDPTYLLKQVKVYYSNRSLPNQYGFSFHGFSVVTAPIPTVANPAHWPKHIQESKLTARVRQKAKLEGRETKLEGRDLRVFNFASSSFVYTPFSITEELVKKTQASKHLSDKFKKIITTLEKKQFVSKFHALRTILCMMKDFDLAKPFVEKGKQFTDQEKLDEIDRINFIASYPKQNPYKDYAQLSWELCVFADLNKDSGPMVPFNENSWYSQKDCKAVKDNFCKLTEVAGVHSTSMYEVFALQSVAQRFREARAIKNADLAESNDPHHHKSAEILNQKLLDQLVDFKYVPLTATQANCNKSTATFLEVARHHSMRYSLYRCTEESLTPDDIKSASVFSIGSTQRMLFWGSDFLNNIANQVKKLLVQTEVSETKQAEKDEKEEDYVIISTDAGKVSIAHQYLVNHKYDILEAIKLLDISKQILALEQIADPEAPLGKIFSSKIEGKLRGPDPSRGALLEASKRLKVIKEDIARPEKENLKPLK